ncbi:MAG: methylamine utilization protein MauJ [Thermodesulfovibrionales bacterium]
MDEGPYIPHCFGEKLKELYKSHRGWLTCAVHHSIPWPEKDVLVQYAGDDYFLRGLKEHGKELSSACITVRMSDKSDLNNILKKIYVFSSILGWFKRGYVDVVGYTYGSHPILYSSGKQPFMPIMCSGEYGFNCNYMPIVKDNNKRKALSFWREGLRLEHIHEGYSFLSFYKVIESQFKQGKKKGDWINSAILTLNGKAGERVKALQHDNVDAGLHVFKSCRCAVVHASLDDEIIDPDIPEDRTRIQQDLVIVHALAEKFIREELNIPDEMDVHRERNALKPLHEYIEADHLTTLSKKGTVPRMQLGLNGIEISVNHWPHDAPEPLKNLVLKVKSAHNGLVDVRAENKDKSISLSFLFSFVENKASTNIEGSGYLSVEDGGIGENEIAFLEYQKAVIGNGIIELQLPSGQKVVCEIVIPVNIDIGRTFESIDQRIEKIRQFSGRKDTD